MSTTSDSAGATQRIDPVSGLSGAELDTLLKSILVVIPYRGSENVDANLENKVSYWRGCGLLVEKVEDQFGGFIELQRAQIAWKFLTLCEQFPHLDKLVMIDSDQDVSEEAPIRLAQWDMPVVSGVVCTPSSKRGLFANFTVKDKYGVPRFPSVKHTKMLPARGLLSVHSSGTGLICIKKNVLETIFSTGDIPFFIDDKIKRAAVKTGVMQFGEDTWFSRQCNENGFERFIDFSVRAIHYKRFGVSWPSTGLDSDLRAEEFQVDVKDMLHG